MKKKIPRSHQVKFLPFDVTIDVPPGTSLLDAASQAQLPLRATCGGEGTCGDCTLQILSGKYQGKLSSALSENLVSQGYALACLTEINDNLTVQLPQFQQLSIKTVLDSTFFAEHENEISGIFEVDPPLKTIGLESDVVIKTYGIACDVGTTTVVLYLVDLKSGEIVNTASGYNHQLKCGEDIISRINYALKPGHLRELSSLILMTINNLIGKAVEQRDISPEDIYYASISGNTTMLHLLLNIDPQDIRIEPYTPDLDRISHIVSGNAGLKMNQEGKIHCAPAVGSYVGGDITAGLLCTPLLREAEKISLFIDVGTNGELVIGNRDWLVTCACSAGPAFEGSGIKCGVPATEGAIEQVRLKSNGELEYHVIGDSKPRGLCGSGLVDLLAELFVHGYIDRGGKLNEKKAGKKIVRTETGKGFLVEEGKNCYWERDLIITENDIANLIRTKGAVFSACSLLLKNVGLDFDGIDSVYIAGGFGQHLDIENAVRIGLFPDLVRNRFHYLGNSSLLGAYLILLSDKNRELVSEIAKKMTYIELNNEPGYMNEYTGALFLPHTDMDLFPSVEKVLKPLPEDSA